MTNIVKKIVKKADWVKNECMYLFFKFLLLINIIICLIKFYI